MKWQIVLPLLFAWGATAQGQEFVVHTPDGPLPPAVLVKIDADWSVRLGGKTPRLIAGDDFISLHRAGAALPEGPTTNFLLLTNGDRIPLDFAGTLLLEDESLIFQPVPRLKGSMKPPRIPLANLAGLVVAPPDGEADAELLFARLFRGQRSDDLLILKTGDRIEGKLKDISASAGIWIDIDGRKVLAPLASAALLALNTDLQAKLQTKKPHALVVFAGGGRVHFSKLRVDLEDKLLIGQAVGGFEMAMPLEKVVAIEMREGRAKYLSDLKPKAYEHKPFVGLKWDLALDRAVTGRPLRLINQTFSKGLGMHAPSKVTYNLDGGYRWFEASVGLDPTSGRRGHARVSVLIDGKPHESCAAKDFTIATTPLPVRIDVRKARELTLVVDVGDLGDVQAHINWVDARLIRD